MVDAVRVFSVLTIGALGSIVLASRAEGQESKTSYAERTPTYQIDPHRNVASSSSTQPWNGRRRMNNPAMFVVGSVLTGLGMTAAVVSPIAESVAAKSSRGQFMNFGPAIGFFAGELAALNFLGVGIPFMAIGGHSVPDRRGTLSMPSVSAGLGTVSMDWRF